MKKYAAGLISVSVVMLSGLLFIGFGGMVYTSMGTQGEITAANIAVSLLFCIVLLSVSIFCGYKRASGVLLGGMFTFAAFLAIGIMCYTGYSVLIGKFVVIYYIISAPFVPLIESITSSLHLYSQADMTMILIPALVFVSSFTAYFIGRGIKAKTSITVQHGTGKVSHERREQLTA